MPLLPRSVLDDVVKELPDNWSMTNAGVRNFLKKKGVKEEELEYSDAVNNIGVSDDPKSPPVTKLDLQRSVKQRNDKWSEYTSDGRYTDVTLSVPNRGPAGSLEDTNYRENVRELATTNAKRDVSSHFNSRLAEDLPYDTKNYLFHSRTSDYPMPDGTTTHMVHEIQSDLHQAARQNVLRTAEDIAYYFDDRVIELAEKMGEAELRDSAEYKAIVKEYAKHAPKGDGYTGKSGTLPESPLKENWHTKAIEQELLRAVELGRGSISVPLEGAKKQLARSDGVQKWYETTIRNVLKKTAKRIGGVYKETEVATSDKSLTTIGTIEMPVSEAGKTPEWTKKLELYSAAGGTGMLGASPEEAKAEQPSSVARLTAGESFDDIVATKYEGNKEAAQDEIANELSGEIKLILDSKEFTEAEVRQMIAEDFGVQEDVIDKAFTSIPIAIPELQPIGKDNDLTEETTNSLYSMSQNAHAKYIPALGGLLPTSVVSDSKAREFRKTNLDISANVANSLRALGRNVDIIVDESGNPQLVEIQRDGSTVELEDGFWESLANSKVELASGAAGFLGGTAATAAMAGKAYQGPGAPFVKGLAGLIGGAAVTGVAAAGGRGIDAAYNAYKTKQDLDYQHYKEVMVDAGVMAGTMDIVGMPVIWAGGKIVRGIGSVFVKFTSGNKQGAYKALKDMKHLDDKQVDEIIAEWEKVTGSKAPGITRANKALSVLPQTESGLDTIIKGAAGRSPKMSIAVATSVSERSKNLQHAAKNLTTDNVATVINDDLNKYVGSVKDFYSGIKKLGTDSMESSSYRFDYDKLAIEPVLNDIEKRITNPAVLERFQTMLVSVREVGGEQSQLRTFGDLIELRRTINGFKHNSKISSALDYGSINKVIRNLDDEIENAALKEMPDGKLWVQEWRKANTEYSKMLQLNENVLYKALTAEGVNHKKIVNSLRTQITSLDGTFMKVISKLPPGTRAKAEGAVMDEMVRKHTHGAASGLQATDFPALSEELRHLGFSDVRTRELKRSVAVLAKVFKNDPDLARVTGNVTKTSFNTSLTADPRAKAKFELATTMFDYVRRVLPTEKADYLALEMHIAKLLKEPRNSKSIESLAKVLGNDPEMTSKIRQFSIQMTKFGEQDQYPYVSVHRTAVPGKAHKVKDGKLGKGIYWTTDADEAKARAAKTGGSLLKEDLLPSRIATMADVERLYGGKDVTPIMLKDPLLKKALKDNGFDGLSIDKDIVVFQ